MLTRLIGDIHGMTNDYKAYCLGDFSGPSVQLGDFGVGFGQSDYWHESIDQYHCDNRRRFIRGNHDNPAQCRLMHSWIPDGTVENDIMYIGGAWSIDNPIAPPGWYRRTAGFDWWDDEECSDVQFEHFFEIYKTHKPRVMITHDCAQRVSYSMFWGSGLVKGPVYPNRTAEWFNRFIDAHEPEYHFFGHWHHSMQFKYHNTHYVCLGELDYIDVDLSSSDQIHQAICEKFGSA
jgi:hypothetical protein